MYFDCFAGVSGDMVLGALIALGVSVDHLTAEISKLGLKKFSISSESVDRSGISATRALVHAPDEKNHRHLPEIEKMITDSTLSEWVKGSSIKIFRRLAVAEATVHGIDITKVHFHEVGALDSIIDIVGSCVGFEVLGVTSFRSSKLHVGSGFVKMAHGKFPVPPPAVAELLREVPTYSTEIEGELVTPTGAAIVSTLSASFGSTTTFTAESVGYGAGNRDYKGFPNTLRLLLGQSSDSYSDVLESEILVVLEANLDDMDGESLAHLSERALEAGALDFWLTPIQMKKGRPATMASILCRRPDARWMGNLLLNQTTSLGYRMTEVARQCLARVEEKISTPHGDFRVKSVIRPDGRRTFKVEYDDLQIAAQKTGISLSEMRERVSRAVSALKAKSK